MSDLQARTRAVRRLLAVCAITLASRSAGATGWTSIGPDGGPVHGFAQAPSDPERLYSLPKQSGVYRSDDRGATWRRVDRGLPVDASLAGPAVSPVDADLVLVAYGNNTVARSTDGGATWDVRAIAADWINVRQILFSPHDPDVVLVASERGPAPGIYRSTDAGLTWHPSHSGIVSPGARAVAFHPSSPGTVLAATRDGAYRSLDDGMTWALVDTDGETDVYSIDFCPGSPSRVWAGASAVLRSDDAGVTFTVVKPCTSVLCTASRMVEAHPTDPGVALSAEAFLSCPSSCSQQMALLRTTDAGVSWTEEYRSPEAPQQNQAAGAIHFDPASPQDAWFALSSPASGTSARDGLFRSTDGGASWSPSMVGIRAIRALQIGFGADGGPVLRAGGRMGLWRAAAPGAPWVDESASPPGGGFEGYVPTWFDIHPGANGVYHEVGWSPSGFDVVYGWLSRTTDGGQTWSHSLPPLIGFFSAPNLVIADRNGGSGLYIWDAGAPAMFRSENGGLSFSISLPPFVTDDAVVDPSDSDRIFAAGTSLVQFSADAGSTWVSRSQGLPGGWIERIFLDPSDPDRLGVVYRTAGTFRSDDAGATWVAVSSVPGARTVVDADWDPVADRFVFATQNDGVYLTGVGWVNLRLSTRDLTVVRFTPSADAIVLGTAHSGVFLHPVPASQVHVAEAPEGPGPIALQVFPNPSLAGHGVDIVLSAPGAGHAAVEVFSVDGRRVRAIWSGMPGGETTVRWEGRSTRGAPVPAGVYFARLQADGKSVTRRFVLLGE
jgi:photosystem II stability/assembly factor-like uncharacterized protein